MYQKDKFKYFEDHNNQVLEMDYKDQNYSMGVILPWKNGKLPNVDSNQIIDYTSRFTSREVKLWFPKFEHRKKVRLVPILKKLGISRLFTPYVCQLDKLAKNIFVSDIIHEAVVIVDETGTEAAAATGIFMMDNCIREKPKIIEFKADHSFIYYIRHKDSNTLLFVGD